MEFMMFFAMFVTFAAGMFITVDCDRNGGTFVGLAIGYACFAMFFGLLIGMIIVSNI